MFDFPASPANGQTFIPAAGGPAYVWDGVAWKLSSGGLSGSVFIGDTPPANPVHGQLWWESDTGNTFIYYQDANSGQWVQFNVAEDAGTDHIASISADMWLGFRSGGNYLALTNKVDGSGSEVFTLTDTGVLSAGSLSAGKSILASQVLSNTTTGDYLLLCGGKVDAGANHGANIVLYGPTAAGPSVMEFRQLGTSKGMIQANGSWLFSTAVGMTLGLSVGAGIHAQDTNGAVTIYSGYPSAMGVTFTGPGTDYGIVTRNVVGGNAVHMNFIYYTTQVGSITTSGTATAYNTTSDIRTKMEIKQPQDARALVDAIQVVEYVPVELVQQPEGHRRFADSFDTVDGVEPPENPTMMGIPAQQAYTVYPAAVTPPDAAMEGYNPDAKFGDEDFKPWMVDYSKFVPMLMANTQGNNSRLDALEARLAALETA